MTHILLLHAAATLTMTGVIWFVQTVHYPLFRFASIGDFPGFAASHQSRTAWLVAPLMSAELVTAAVLVVGGPPEHRSLTVTGLLLLAVIWLSTALVQVPLHRRLGRGFDGATARRLVATNWPRTLLWSLRSAIALLLVAP